MIRAILSRSAVILPLILLAACQRSQRWEQTSALGADLYDQGLYSQAQAPAKEALAMAGKWFGPQDLRTLYSMELVGKLYHRTGNLEAGRKLLQAASQASIAVFGESHPRRARFLASLAELKTTAGEYDEAEELYQQVLVMVQQAHGPISGPAAAGFAALGTLYTDWGVYESAEPVLARAEAILDRTPGPDKKVRAAVQAGLCRIRVESGRLEDAAVPCASSLAARQALLPERHPDLARSLTGMGLYHLRSGRLEKARAHIEQAFQAYKEAPASDPLGMASALLGQAEIQALSGSMDQAELSFEKAETYMDSPYATIKAQIRKAGALLRAGKPAEAETLLSQAMALHAETPKTDKLDRKLILLGLGKASAAQGKLKRAEKFLTRSLEGMGKRCVERGSSKLAALAELGRVQVRSGRRRPAEMTARCLAELGGSYRKGGAFQRHSYKEAIGIYHALGLASRARKLEDELGF